ncbi:helix-turn-helix transcriptional regulator [Oceanibaculum indicum]|uniref:DNA-binding NarL/FixJ family response regulator n=1 Tax=Oceanibaculum indicum TaxID=526216 RepID=A0A420WGI0_9PROT|nr:response regulator transcription factor [Oceanibaculum indicum]RKQ70055.1 DNA-binding NarL/FixJ family response regulator [Oceanibaculum indicum]
MNMQAEARSERFAPDFQSVLSDITRLIEARAITLYTPHLAPSDPRAVWAATGMPQEALNEYAAYYGSLDVWTQAATRDGLPPKGSLIVSDELLPPEDLRRSEFYNDYLKPYEIGRTLVSIVDDGKLPGFPRVRLSIVRAEAQRPFDAREKATLGAMQQLLRTVMRLHQGSILASGQSQLEVLAFDRLKEPIFILDADTSVLASNEAARRIAQSDPRLQLLRGRLVFSKAGDNNDLRTALAALEAGREAPVFLQLSSSMADGSPLSLILSRPSGLTAGQTQNCIVLQVLDAEAAGADDKELLVARLALTEAEAVVALGVARGMSHEDIARLRQTKVSTVRTILQRLYEKLRINKSTELSRLVHQTLSHDIFLR